MSAISKQTLPGGLAHWQERVDLAAAFRWTVRLNMHEAVANHFSLAVNDDGTRFLMNPNQKHFGLIRASDLLELDANDPEVLSRPGAPDPTAWGLHGAIHRHCPQARCLMHVHSIYATVLSTFQDSYLKPIDLNTATFFNRMMVDERIQGLAFESEGERCAALLTDPRKKVLVLGNHGVLVMGDTVAETFTRLFYFERAAETYVKALQANQPLRILSDQVAESIAADLDHYPDQAERHLADIKALLDEENSSYAS